MGTRCKWDKQRYEGGKVPNHTGLWVRLSRYKPEQGTRDKLAPLASPSRHPPALQVFNDLDFSFFFPPSFLMNQIAHNCECNKVKLQNHDFKDSELGFHILPIVLLFWKYYIPFLLLNTINTNDWLKVCIWQIVHASSCNGGGGKDILSLKRTSFDSCCLLMLRCM